MYEYSVEACHAIRAAENINNWGSYAAAMYARRHGVYRLFVRALQLQAVSSMFHDDHKQTDAYYIGRYWKC